MAAAGRDDKPGERGGSTIRPPAAGAGANRRASTALDLAIAAAVVANAADEHGSTPRESSANVSNASDAANVSVDNNNNNNEGKAASPPAASTSPASSTPVSTATTSTAAATKAPVVTRRDTLVEAPEMEQRVFDSWEDFHAYLSEYGKTTSQLYSVRSATPAARRNGLVSKKAPPQRHQLIPEQFVHYVKTVTCTHGGKPRPRSTGVRPNHQHRAIECPAQINACVQRDTQGVWRVHVTNMYTWHNHDISPAIYNGYPEVRNALAADVLATVNILRKAEAKRKKIHEYIVENTAYKPKMKDVHNLLSRLKRIEGASRAGSSGTAAGNSRGSGDAGGSTGGTS